MKRIWQCATQMNPIRAARMISRFHELYYGKHEALANLNIETPGDE